jgi:SAM-dependent methyltransferase
VVGLTPELLRFVRAGLPAAPARVLEVGAGGGELAAVLRGDGYDVVAIDPASESAGVLAVALGDLDAPAASFDAALAVVSLHHVDPLEASCRRLADVIRRGGRLVVDEFDVSRLDERAAAWWLARREPHDHGPATPAQVVADLREHVHPLGRVRTALEERFALEETVRGPYLHRWSMPPGVREAEEQAIAAGDIPATGARMVGVRR